jgi:hypothetical protein
MAPRGQTLVIFAIAALALVFFIGLAVDSGSLYVSYGQLKRAVDAAAVAAANEYKKQESGGLPAAVDKMYFATNEIFQLQGIDVSTALLNTTIKVCDLDGDGFRDADLMTTAPDFFDRCPVTKWPDPQWGSDPDHPIRQQKKLVYIKATQEAPLYFLHLLGFSNIPITTESIAEAASVDLVLVFDTSESMASDKLDSLCAPYVAHNKNCPYVDNYDPNDPGIDNEDPDHPKLIGCNLDNTCEPLKQAKDAAKALLSHLYDGYDRVGIVTFDSEANIRFTLGQNDLLNPKTHLQEAADTIDAIPLHNDAPYALMWPQWKMFPGAFNPVNPEDRDGDGSDSDPTYPPCWDNGNTVDNTGNANCCDLTDPLGHDPGEYDRWDESRDFWVWGGVPCDESNKKDAYDMNGEFIWSGTEWIRKFIYTEEDDQEPGDSNSPLSTCSGCGMRVGSNVLRQNGRSGSVWVMVFLSDGAVNLSDTPKTDSTLDSHYPNGFCTGGMGQGWWTSKCYDEVMYPRHCLDTTAVTCPPGAIWDGTTPNLNYSVLDYALDMTDTAALTKSLNLDEPGGNEMSIYTIGLGSVGDPTSGIYTVGEQLLRYMAAVGDDGDRETDPCQGVPAQRTCGQYYYAPSGGSLEGIFLDIASRIYTRISE